MKPEPEDAIEVCKVCNGTGSYDDWNHEGIFCDTCFGEGYIRQKHVDQGLISG